MKLGLRWTLLTGGVAPCCMLTPAFGGADAGKAESAPAGEIGYNEDIRPILSNRCFKCHGPDLKKANLNLRDPESALKNATVPGNPADSPLLARVTSAAPKKKMPAKGDALA